MFPFNLAGPQFLLFYIIFGAVVILGVVFWRRRAELSDAPPRVDLSDPYLIAYLRGGEAEVLRVATVTLIDRGLLVRNGRQIQRAENAPPDAVRRPVEQALLKKYSRSGEVSWMFEDDGLKKACESYGATLRRARLLPDEYVTQARVIRLVVASFLLGGVGLAKVVIALDAGRTNVGFLVVLIIAAVVIAAAVSFPRLTASGRAMIDDVQSLYGGLRAPTSSVSAGGAGNEPMMLAAVFGVGALAGPAFSYAESLFPDAKKRSSSNSCATDSGCGSSGSSSSDSGSDSSGSSSSCGSSCGGGSGCGGGCGGCGGS